MQKDWPENVSKPSELSLQRLATIVYALQAASLFTGTLTLFAGAIINYVRREDVKGSWIESHFLWQIKTFWYSLLWMVIGGITTIFLVGWGILLATSLWLIYRLAKGWVYLNKHRPIAS